MSFWIQAVMFALVKAPCTVANHNVLANAQDPFEGQETDVVRRSAADPKMGIIGNFNLSSYSMRVERTVSAANAEGGLRSVSSSASQRDSKASRSAAADEVSGATPVAKVISLIENLKKQVEEEGESEAASYDEFACFCKTTTEKKGTSIKHHHDAVAMLSAEIQEADAKYVGASLKKEDLTKKIQDNTVSLKAYETNCEKDAVTFEAAIADLTKAVTALQNAHKALVASKPDAKMLLLSVQRTVRRSLAFARSLNLGLTQHAQGPVSSKDAAYEYHSQGILDTIIELQTTFGKKKDNVTIEAGKAKRVCDSSKAALAQLIKIASDGVDDADEEMTALKQQMANAREGMTNSESVLKDDEVYIKDLTTMCETKARDWDQRTQMRGKELEALAGALSILKDKVAGRESRRALLLSQGRSTKKDSPKPISFLQKETPVLSMHSSVLVQAHADAQAGVLMARQSSAAVLLSQAASRTQSAALSMLALRVNTDPFTEVKTLIQRLIERLLKEATSEVTKKGFCDEEMSRAEGTRDQKFEEIEKLQVELAKLEAKKDSLTAAIDAQAASVKQQQAALAKADELREQERALNAAEVVKAQEGEEAVSEALVILRAFYEQMAESLLQASPVDEDTSGPLFSGSYSGKQGASRGIIGMLEVILADFKRTFKTTQQMESSAAAEHVELERAIKADIAGKETKKTLDEQELTLTTTGIESNTASLISNTREMDDALRALEALQPTCVDTGMSYQERVDKRNEELAALKKALCILDPEGVEKTCEE